MTWKRFEFDHGPLLVIATNSPRLSTVGTDASSAVVVEERVDVRFGAALLWPLLATGILSLMLWRWTGDLRLYGWVQFFPGVALPLLFLVFPPRYTGTFYWLVAVLLYAVVKLFEFADHAVYRSFILSGHTLKHPFAAAACFAIVRYFQKRQPIA